MVSDSAAPSLRRRLRFGVMLDGYRVQEWQARCIRSLLEIDGVQLALVILNDQPRTRGRFSRLSRVRPGSSLFPMYRTVAGRSPAAGRVDMGQELEAAPVLRCRVSRKGRFSEHFSPEDVEAAREYGLDFVVRFGFGIIRGDILTVARYGIWSFHHGDERKYRGKPAAFWEIYNGDPVTGAVLQRLTDRLDGGVILRRGYFRTLRHSYSANLSQVLLESAVWPPQVCLDILHGHADYLDSQPSHTQAPVYRLPTNAQCLRFLMTLLENNLRRVYVYLFRHMDWNVGVARRPIHSLMRDRLPRDVQWLRHSAPHEFLADPFATRSDGRLRVLMEEYDYRRGKGRISHVTLDDASQASTRATALDLPVHLAYPYLFQHDGTLYCIPETYQAREVALYRVERSPQRLTRVATLLEDVAAVDGTVVQHGGRWWLFCTDADGGAYHRLLIWHAPDLLGPWQPHIANPVKLDIGSARPAGTPFVHDDRLYRPAQDCSRSYGGRIVFQEITELSTTRFAERWVGTLEPDRTGPYPHGIHTVSAAGNMTVIDGKRIRFVRSAFVRNSKTLVARAVRAFGEAWRRGRGK